MFFFCLGSTRSPGVVKSLEEIAENKLIDKGSDHRQVNRSKYSVNKICRLIY